MCFFARIMEEGIRCDFDRLENKDNSMKISGRGSRATHANSNEAISIFGHDCSVVARENSQYEPLWGVCAWHTLEEGKGNAQVAAVGEAENLFFW